MIKRASATGRKIRKTRRDNQVKKRISNSNIGTKDANNIIDLLTKDTQTKRGLERSKRLEKLIFEEADPRKLKRFKEFKGIKDIPVDELSMRDVIKSIGRNDYDFYRDNRKLIKEYNTKFKQFKKEYGKGFANKSHDNYSRTGRRELLKTDEAQNLEVSYNDYKREKNTLKDN